MACEMECGRWSHCTVALTLFFSSQLILFIAGLTYHSSKFTRSFYVSDQLISLRASLEWRPSIEKPTSGFGTNPGKNMFTNNSLTHTFSSVFEITSNMSLLNNLCFKMGTLNVSDSKCLCKRGWFGVTCSIPEVVYKTFSAKEVLSNIRLRVSPRRVIIAFPFNHEFHLTEARIDELYPVADVFLIGESNYTFFGDPKPMLLLKKLQDGYLKAYQDKIMHVANLEFPEGGRKDGWIADHHARKTLSRQGIVRLKNTKPDDIFVITDADEIPSAETIIFLKFHDFYPEPVAIHYRFSSYGFFWRNTGGNQPLTAACSLQMLRYLYDNDAYQLRNGGKQVKNLRQRISTYNRLYDTKFKRLVIGDYEHPAGWHCSWCFQPEGIRTKLTNAINGDFPRWGNFPEKLDINYIQSLIRDGKYFDNRKLSVTLINASEDEMFAPKYFTQKQKNPNYRYLIENIYKVSDKL